MKLATSLLAAGLAFGLYACRNKSEKVSLPPHLLTSVNGQQCLETRALYVHTPEGVTMELDGQRATFHLVADFLTKKGYAVHHGVYDGDYLDREKSFFEGKTGGQAHLLINYFLGQGIGSAYDITVISPGGFVVKEDRLDFPERGKVTNTSQQEALKKLEELLLPSCEYVRSGRNRTKGGQ